MSKKKINLKEVVIPGDQLNLIFNEGYIIHEKHGSVYVTGPNGELVAWVGNRPNLVMGKTEFLGINFTRADHSVEFVTADDNIINVDEIYNQDPSKTCDQSNINQEEPTPED